MHKVFIFCLFFLSVCASKHHHKKSKKINRIVGGTSVDIKYYPHQVSLQQYWQHYCGGTLVKSNYVVSSIHCAPWDDLTYFSVKAGASQQTGAGVNIPIETFYMHPKYNKVSQDYDVMIVKLKYSFTLSDVIKTIPLAYFTPPDNSWVVVSGWGRVSENGAVSNDLKAISVPLLSKSVCSQTYSYLGYSDRMICAGNLQNGGKDACQGDSGGPLTYNGELVGIVSWGIGCARPSYPGVYTNVANSEIRRFIIDNTLY